MGLSDRLSAGPSWVALLRLYMKYRRAEDAVNLLGLELKKCRPALEAAGRNWSPLRDFPIALVEEFRSWLSKHANEEPSDDGDATRLLKVLDAILAQFKNLLEEDMLTP